MYGLSPFGKLSFSDAGALFSSLLIETKISLKGLSVSNQNSIVSLAKQWYFQSLNIQFFFELSPATVFTVFTAKSLTFAGINLSVIAARVSHFQPQSQSFHSQVSSSFGGHHFFLSQVSGHSEASL